ncbi:MAG: VOC family protein [Myxococcota bacterium]
MAITRLDHASIYVPDLGEALAWYEDVLSMRVLERSPKHVHLSCFGGSAELTLAKGACGLRDFTFGVDDESDFDRVERALCAHNITSNRTDEGARPGESAALEFVIPSGHRMRLALGTSMHSTGVTRMTSDGTHRPCDIDHINIIGETEPYQMRDFLLTLGFRFSFSIVMGGRPIAAWMRSSDFEHDLAYSAGARPGDSLHHVAFAVEDGNHYFRLSDRMMEHGRRWEFGPGRHNVSLGSPRGFGTNNYAYVKDPADNRNEFCADMDRVSDDAEPSVVEIDPSRIGEVMNGWGFDHPESMMVGS